MKTITYTLMVRPIYELAIREPETGRQKHVHGKEAVCHALAGISRDPSIDGALITREFSYDSWMDRCVEWGLAHQNEPLPDSTGFFAE